MIINSGRVIFMDQHHILHDHLSSGREEKHYHHASHHLMCHYRWFHRMHAPGLKLTSGVHLVIVKPKINLFYLYSLSNSNNLLYINCIK